MLVAVARGVKTIPATSSFFKARKFIRSSAGKSLLGAKTAFKQELNRLCTTSFAGGAAEALVVTSRDRNFADAFDILPDSFKNR